MQGSAYDEAKISLQQDMT